MVTKGVGIYEDPESLADDSGKGDICESDADCNIDGEEFLGSKKCGIFGTKKRNTNTFSENNKAQVWKRNLTQEMDINV